MSDEEFADRMNRLTPEEIATAMESCPTDALEWGVRFEAGARHTPASEWSAAHPAETPQPSMVDEVVVIALVLAAVFGVAEFLGRLW